MKALIVMATHNPRPDLFGLQLASVRAQSLTDWKCLVFDDASVDRQAVASAIEPDGRFELLGAGEHLGAYLAFEHLLAAAPPGAPVFLCDQDDRWWPDKMRRLLAHGGTAFCAMRVVDETGAVVRQRFLPRPPGEHALSPTALLLMNSVSGTALMVSDKVRQASLPFPAPRYRGWHDQWLAAVAARLGELTYLDEVLVDYSLHRDQVVGEGLRRIDRARLRTFGRRLRNQGVPAELGGRTGWIQTAAERLLALPGPDDPDLELLAAGHIMKPLRAGIRRREVPLQRAALLVAGKLASAIPPS